MSRNWKLWAVCEGCLKTVESNFFKADGLPDGWSECGKSQLPMKVGCMAQWCHACKPSVTPSLAEQFFSKPVEVSGTLNVTMDSPAKSKDRASKGVPMKPTLKEAIQKVSQAMQNLLASGLNQDAIVVLIHDRCPMSRRGKKLSKTDIANVLKQLSNLERNYSR